MYMIYNFVCKCILLFCSYIFIKILNFKCLYILFCFEESFRFCVFGNMYNLENDIII